MNRERFFGPLKSSIAAVFCAGLLAQSALAQGAEQTNKTRNEIGVTLSGYRYSEPGTMSLKATKIGFDYSGVYAIDSPWPRHRDGWFVGGDLRFGTGRADYNSELSGSIVDRPNWYYEAKGLLGREFDFGGYSLSLHTGLGFRYLFNDLRGASTTGARGYRRESSYTTLPIGLSHKIGLAGQTELLSTLEIAPLIGGRQQARLSDANAAKSDVELRQRGGYGLRLSTMARFDSWSFGPFLSLWRIKESDRAGSAAEIFEPRNSTFELGLKAAYRF